jgi:hypothetical protein
MRSWHPDTAEPERATAAKLLGDTKSSTAATELWVALSDDSDAVRRFGWTFPLPASGVLPEGVR